MSKSRVTIPTCELVEVFFFFFLSSQTSKQEHRILLGVVNKAEFLHVWGTWTCACISPGSWLCQTEAEWAKSRVSLIVKCKVNKLLLSELESFHSPSVPRLSQFLSCIIAAYVFQQHLLTVFVKLVSLVFWGGLCRLFRAATNDYFGNWLINQLFSRLID